MYIRPDYRGNRFGSQLLIKLIEKAKEYGYSRIRLDSAKFMKSAHRLYQIYGFTEITPYEESEIPPEIQDHWKFMEFILKPQ
jgi:GNAT superfamily N-acetyltransferase